MIGNMIRLSSLYYLDMVLWAAFQHSKDMNLGGGQTIELLL